MSHSNKGNSPEIKSTAESFYTLQFPFLTTEVVFFFLNLQQKLEQKSLNGRFFTRAPGQTCLGHKPTASKVTS